MSVSSGGDCIRTYRPDIKKGRYNTIILHVKTVAADNLLFYLGSAKYVSVKLSGCLQVFSLSDQSEVHTAERVHWVSNWDIELFTFHNLY